MKYAVAMQESTDFSAESGCDGGIDLSRELIMARRRSGSTRSFNEAGLSSLESESVEQGLQLFARRAPFGGFAGER